MPVALERPLVLVVEDEWLIAEQIARKLRRIGCRVLGPVHDIPKAQELLAHETPHAALLDIALRCDTSLSLADRLDRQGIPYVFATGYTRDQLPERFAGCRMLAKPLEEGKLRAEIEAMLLEANASA